MSRYELQALQKNPHCMCAIGWDRPLATYYAQVIDPDCNDVDNQAGFWEGTIHAEYPRPDELLSRIAAWAVVPPELKARLLRDRLEAPAPLEPHPWIKFQQKAAERSR
jgi:hypothetical protein